MTQALALAAFLRDAGHRVHRVLVGRSPHRKIPGYFTEGIGAPVVTFDAPAQVPGRDGQALSIGRTVADAVRRTPRFFGSTRTIAEATGDADVVVNLLDFMGGVSRQLFPSTVPSLAIAHNYLFLHPLLGDTPGPAHVRRMVLAYTRATAAGTERKVALSFVPMPPDPQGSLEVAPPLLRPGLDRLHVHDGGYLLAYVLNPGYGVDLARWQESNPGAVVHCYLEGGGSSLGAAGGPGFHAHALDAEAFLHHLAGCSAYVGSAGFESICEAYYLGKSILTVPTEGQFEQTLNAWDAQRVGVARAGSYDDLDDFWLARGPPDPAKVAAFRAWVGQAPDLFVDTVERTAHREPGGQATPERSNRASG
jgi:hypothetical protein